MIPLIAWILVLHGRFGPMFGAIQCDHMEIEWMDPFPADRLAETMRSHGSKPPAGPASAAKALGLAVRARRRALGLDQLVLCDLAGVGPAFLYSLEHGKPSVRLDKVLAVLAVLGLELHVRQGRALVSAHESLTGTEE